MDDEFTKAFEEEFNDSPPVSEPTQDTEEGAASTSTDEPPVVEPAVETPPTEGTEPQKGAENEEPSGDQVSQQVPDAPQFATKADVMDAMREVDHQRTERINSLSTIKQEIIEKFHPGGIDKNLYDETGRVIHTAQDIVDRGLVKANGEEFTYEEAAQWILDSTRQMNEQIAAMESNAEGLAELNQSLKEGSDRVLELYGTVLDAMPSVRQQLADAYLKTLIIDEKTGLVTKATIDPVEFYGIAMAPYTELGRVLQQKNELEATVNQAKADTTRDERSGLPQRGTSKVKSNTGDEFVDAFIDEMEDI